MSSIKRIEDLKVNEEVKSFFLIKSILCKVANGSNNRYLDMDLVDRTGLINAKLWNCKAEEIEKFKENQIVHIEGSVIEWKGALQLKIKKMRLAEKDDKVDPQDFIPSAPFRAEDMYAEVQEYIEKITNEDIKNIVVEIINSKKEELMYYPAAKSNHHAVRSGLLYHAVTMLKAAEQMIKIYTFLDPNLLYGGIILHDIAKIEEMDSSEMGIVSEYSVEGQLLGHIPMGMRNIAIAAEKVGADKHISMLLQHMVLSHHYHAEYGSPKKPMFAEAEMLHYLDIIDARMYDMHKAISGIERGEFSDKVWSLEGIRIYRHT